MQYAEQERPTSAGPSCELATGTKIRKACKAHSSESGACSPFYLEGYHLEGALRYGEWWDGVCGIMCYLFQGLYLD